jgi:hypothetical protein
MKTRPWILAGAMVLIGCTSASAYVIQYPLGNTLTTTRCSLRGASQSAIHGNIKFGGTLAGDALNTADSQFIIFNSGGGDGCVSYTLPVTGWVRINGNLYYRDTHGTISPVTSVATPGDAPRITLRSSASQPFTYPLSAAPQGSVSVILLTPYADHTCSASLDDLCSTDADCGGAPGSCQAAFVENCGTFISPTKDNAHAFVSNTLAPITSCPTPPPACPLGP